MKVLLADPPQRERAYDAAYPNMGILYLIGSARQAFAGSGMTFEYLESQYDLPGHLQAIERIRPDLYGLSYASFTSPLAHPPDDRGRARAFSRHAHPRGWGAPDGGLAIGFA